MLSENHSARTQQTSHDDDDAKPPYGVIGEGTTESDQCSCHPSDGCCVGTDFPEYVDDGAHHLYGQGHHDDTTHEMRDMQQVHDIVAEEVAHNGDDIGNGASFPRSEFDPRPSLVFPIDSDETCGKKNGTEIDKAEYRQLVVQRQHTHIAEYEQEYESYGSQIERVENSTDHPGCKYDVSFSQFFSP